MSFNNGYPTGSDRKLPLYAFEPEQISDIVAVPNLLDEFAKLNLITNDYIPRNTSERFIQRVNFPLSVNPCLFQRYNPSGIPFADKYSLKLYTFLAKYSYLNVANATRFFTVPTRDFAETKYLSFPMGNEVKIILPKTRKKIQLSYYYPEINPYEYNLFLNSQVVFKVTPDIGQDWRNIQPFGNTPTFGRERAYEFRRIQTDCYVSPTSRKWKLQCHTLFCDGQEIKLDRDILISSLLLTYFDFTQEEIDNIENQVPECYLYSYLDTFFELVENKLLESNPALRNPKIASQAGFNLAIEYFIDHYQNKKESVYFHEAIRCNGQTTGYVSELIYSDDDPNNKYAIGAQEVSPLSITSQSLIDLPKAVTLGGLTYANNNYWNNYQFNLKDLGREVLFESANTTPTIPSRFFLTVRYLGNSGGLFDNSRLPGINGQSFDNGLPIVNTFARFNPDTQDLLSADGKEIITDASPTRYTDVFERTKTINREVKAEFNNYYLYLLYDDIEQIPSLNISIGNYLDETYTTAVMNVKGKNLNIMRLQATKVFHHTTRLYLSNINLSNNNSFFDPKLSVSPLIKTIDVIGNVDSTFYKYGQEHPTALTTDKKGSGSCSYTFRPVTYSIGYDITPGFLSGTQRFESNAIIYSKVENNSSATSGNPASYLKSGKYTLEQDQAFSGQGIIDLSRSIILNPTTKLKPLKEYEPVSVILNKLQTAYEVCYMSLCDYEELRKQIEEIWLTLDAGKFAYEDKKPNVSRVANLGYYIERIARVLGISVNSNGSIRSLRQSKRIASGDTIPAGWNLGQWGRNNGGDSAGQQGGKAEDEKDGLAWEIRTNQFKNDDFTGESNAIEQGGFALVENLPQLLHIIMSDLDRAFDLQNAGANVLPTPNGEQIASYQGMNSMLLDLLFTLGQISRQTTGTHILAMKNQAINQELLSGFGLPVAIKELEISAGKPELGVLPFPGFAPNAPTLNDLHALTLTNVGALIGSKIELPKSEEELEEQEEANKKLAEPEEEKEIEILKEKD